jgi:asparagine synthase (glutamine-hydrolysing)
MCGIAGIYERAGAADRRVVDAMTSRLVHRGPDGEGFHVDEHIALGMRRLAIVDVERGQQPLKNERGDVVVVFNGEIYNHGELRRWLRSRGHRLGSRSDGAVLPHLYEELGDGFVERLNGIFAIALWDAEAASLVLARDRFGVKPLYWSTTGAHVAFASELKALLCDPAIPRTLDLAAIDEFLTFRFIPSPATPFAAVRRVRPGALVTVTPSVAHERVYWYADTADRVWASEADLVERYAERFEQAVVRQMMSDRPIGVMLSGGVDSGAVTAVLARHSSRVRTFTIGFEEGGDADETALAERTAKMFDTQHESVVVPTADYLERLPESYAILEEPVGTSSAACVAYVAALMRPDVPVALSGQGADELMGGYWRYVGAALAQSLRPLSGAARAAGQLPLGPLSTRVRRGLSALAGESDLDRLMNAYGLFTAADKMRLYRSEVLGALHTSQPAAAVERLRRLVADRPLLDQMLFVDARLWLPDELLLIADKMSMSESVELRVPFLDPDLVALAESIPGSLRVHHLRRKYVHKRAMAKLLPPDIVHRKERGWATPMSSWLRAELEPLLRDVLLGQGGLCRELFHAHALRAMIDEHGDGRQDLARQLFCLLSLGLWHQSCVGSTTGLSAEPMGAALRS